MACRLRVNQKVISKAHGHIIIGTVTNRYQTRVCSLRHYYDILTIQVEESIAIYDGIPDGRWKGHEVKVIDDLHDKDDVKTCIFDAEVWEKMKNICSDIKKVPKYSNMTVKFVSDIRNLIYAARGFEGKEIG